MGWNFHGYGPQTPGMRKIVADVHKMVDQHREFNGQRKWLWGIPVKLQIFIPGWLAKWPINHWFAGKKRP